MGKLGRYGLFLLLVITIAFQVSEHLSDAWHRTLRQPSNLGEAPSPSSNNFVENELYKDIATVDQPKPEAGEIDEQSMSFGEIGLEQGKLREVAENIFNVNRAMTDKYSVSDGLGLTMYILRYMAEIGEYELVQKDILHLVKAFEDLAEEKIQPEVMDFIRQIRKIRFGQKKGKYWVEVFALDKKKGIVMPLNEKSDVPESSLKEIIAVVVKDRAQIYFDEADSEEKLEEVSRFVKTPVKILGVFEKLAEDLDQVHPDMRETIDEYLDIAEKPAHPLLVDFDGIYVHVDTSTLFKDIKFNFNKGVALPGMRLGSEPVPSFLIRAKAKLLNLKVSIDQ